MEQREHEACSVELAQQGLATFLKDFCNVSDRDVRIAKETLKVSILYMQADPRQTTRIFLDLRQKLLDLKAQLTPGASEAMLFCYDCTIELILRCLPEEIATRLSVILKRDQDLPNR